MMRHPKKKNWPPSWKQARPGGTFTLAGRSFEAEFVVLPFRVDADDPQELAERIEEAIVKRTGPQRPS